MQVDAAAALEATGGWHGDVDRSVKWAQEAPEDCGRSVTKNRSLATRKDGGHETAVETQSTMADGIDASVNAVKLTTIDAIPDRPRSHASRFKLPARNRTMLPHRNSRHLGIRRVAFLTHVGI